MQRVQLAEALDAQVCTDLKIGASFPTDHPLHHGNPATFATDDLIVALKDADVILSLDWVDLAGTFKAVGGMPSGTVIQVSLDQNLHNGWSMDYEGLPAVDLFIAAETDHGRARCSPDRPEQQAGKAEAGREPASRSPADGKWRRPTWPTCLRHVVGDRKTCLTHVPLSWDGNFWEFRHPLDYHRLRWRRRRRRRSRHLGRRGARPKGCGRLPIAICGDGDFLMGATAVWTAVHYRIPLLIVVANNRSFYNDEVHQERVAVARNRPVENKWIGQRIADPDIDMAMVARGQGASGFGPCWNPANWRRRSRKRSRWSRKAASQWSTRASLAATARRLPRRWRAATSPTAAADRAARLGGLMAVASNPAARPPGEVNAGSPKRTYANQKTWSPFPVQLNWEWLYDFPQHQHCREDRMKTRRQFLGGVAATGAVFCSCHLLDQRIAHAQPAPRRQVVVNGRRVRTVDIHAHVAFAETNAMLGEKPNPPTQTTMADRLKAMDEQGIDVEALSINAYWYKADRDLAEQADQHPEPEARRTVRGAARTASSPSPQSRCSIPISPREQLEHAVKKLGLRGAAIGGSVDGEELADPKFHPFWAKAEELGVPGLHPSAGHAD